MENNFNLSLISISLLTLILSGCTTTRPNNGQPTISVDSADKERQEIIAEYKKEHQNQQDKEIFIQPVNKSDPCLLSSEFVSPDKDAKNYWIGACQAGYAIGKGRVISIAGAKDHTEAFLNINSEHLADGPFVQADITNGTMVYGQRLQESSAEESGLGNKVLSFLGSEEKPGKQMVDYVSVIRLNAASVGKGQKATEAFSGRKTKDSLSGQLRTTKSPITKTIVIKDGVKYLGTNLRKVPRTEVVPVKHVIETFEQKTGKPIGLRGVTFQNNTSFAINTQTNERVNVDPAFFDDISKQLNTANAMAKQAASMTSKVPAFLEEYTKDICNPKAADIPNGLSKQQFSQVCQFIKKVDQVPDKEVKEFEKQFEKDKEKAAQILAQNEKKWKEQQEFLAKMAMYREQIEAARAQKNAAESQKLAAEMQAFSASMSQIKMPQFYIPTMDVNQYAVQPIPFHSGSMRMYNVNQLSPNMYSVQRLR